ncbi:MAG: ankyrin repeat domain-containing protein [Bacteroidota bacterium]
MKTLTRYTLAIACLVLFTTSSIAQSENIFHDRKFWKEQPSLKEVKAKIKEGNSPTALTEHNFDAIGYAILEKAPLKTIKFLLTQGNDVNKLTHDARTYVFWAAYKGNLELMKFLVEMGAKTNLIDQHGYSLLMFTAVTGQEDQAIYDYILELGADIISERDRSGRDALLAYISSTKTGNMIEYFIKKGLNIHSLDEKGNGAFNYAAKTGDKELMERLINDYEVNTQVNEKTNENAILFASTRFSREGLETSIEFYQYLQGLGLDPAIVSKDGKTVLHNLAFRSNNKELFEFFIKQGVDVNQVDSEGNTALINASSRRNEEIISYLLDITENINHQNKDGLSAFARALKYHKLEIAKLIASNGAETNVVDNKGYNLSYHLVDAFRNMKTFTEKMNYLISVGHDPSIAQKDGSTLLHAAINKENVELLKYLVRMGIDINTKDNSGQTVLHYAAMQADDETILKYLIEAGADKSMTTEFDESAHDLAQANEILVENNTNIDFLKTGGE